MRHHLASALILALAACAGRPDGITAITPPLAVANLERGVYPEVRLGVQAIDLVAADGRRDRLDAPTTRGGSQVRGDVLAAVARGRDRGHAIAVVEAPTTRP